MNDIRKLTALVVYESMFGNTSAVAEAVAEGLRLEGLEVTLTHVHDAPNGDDCDCDLLVVGAPTHAFSLSRPSTREDAVRQGAPAEAATGTGLREWIASMKETSGAPRVAATFDTRVTKVRRIPKAASTRAARLLSRNGFRLVSRPAGFLVTDTSGPLEEGELERATAWGRSVGAATRDRMLSSATGG